MGCGSSTETGRDHQNKLPPGTEAFFPSPPANLTRDSARGHNNNDSTAPKELIVQTVPLPPAARTSHKPSKQQQQRSSKESSSNYSTSSSPKKKTVHAPPNKQPPTTKTNKGERPLSSAPKSSTPTSRNQKKAYVPPAPILSVAVDSVPTTVSTSSSGNKNKNKNPSSSPNNRKQPSPSYTLPSSTKQTTIKLSSQSAATTAAAMSPPMRVVEQEDEEDASLSHDDVLLETEQRCPDDVIESVKELLSGNSDTDIFDIIGQEHRPPNFTSMVGTEEQEEEEEEEESMPQRPVGLHETPLPSSESGRPFDELYRLKGILGTGAFSTVREGYHRSNVKQSYAIKCINRKKLSEDDEAALLDEVAILKELRHTHIIRLYDFFEEPSAYYLVMERMRGGELFDRIVAKAYYNEKEARDTCKLIIQAVAHCHDNHIAHRDLKPENLLLLSETDDTSVKLADFGFAKKVYERSSLRTQCGTPGYVAPEILEGSPYDERADLWSVGVILYILLGGYPPFIESTQRELFRKIRKGDYEFHEEYWGTVSSEAKELIASLLTVDVNKRLSADDALENQWILGDDAKLAQRDLGSNLEKFRNFNAKRKFRAAVSTVMAINKLKSFKEAFFTPTKENVLS